MGKRNHGELRKFLYYSKSLLNKVAELVISSTHPRGKNNRHKIGFTLFKKERKGLCLLALQVRSDQQAGIAQILGMSVIIRSSKF